ncbi:hypothetical protein DYU05_20615 [Mucilaginibacter terrenus]|uniref:Uncharacterized protein n=1 Tax=Mucilaginibacter terrenus TaxID=2482727 RepID=A0A3E2NJ48_9SPHI|nr:hypothetical protein [Mucilaginibacter terrenus]RFZ81026.1 hypothetical protein DYU05_20615 [Mucilaginibacter terrenus]
MHRKFNFSKSKPKPEDYLPKNLPEDPDYYYHIELITDLSNDQLTSFEHKLESHPFYEALKNNFIFNKEKKALIHILHRVDKKEIEEFSEKQKRYYPICSKEEIYRLSDPKSSEDMLLLLRAEEVAENPTLQRICFRAMEEKGERWNFTKYFDSPLFSKYKSYLNHDTKQKCWNIPAGFFLMAEANGSCWPTEFGNFITVSYHLKQFFYYMNLWEHGERLNVPEIDCQRALLLAIRTIMQFESPDFELDPRGLLPKRIHRMINNMTNFQLTFIIGHEFAHHYLGHLEGKCITREEMLHAVSVPGERRFYSTIQEQEFDADYYAIASTTLDGQMKELLLAEACAALFYFDIYECIHAFESPFPNSHPPALERIQVLREKFPELRMFNNSLDFKINRNRKLKESLNDQLSWLYADLERDGSVYLPSYKRKIMNDRLDF